MIKEQNKKSRLELEGVTTKIKQNKSLKKEIMSNHHGMVCGDCQKTTDITALVRSGYLKGLTFGTFPIHCEHCRGERTVTLDFSK
jgi:hypothetical protein